MFFNYMAYLLVKLGGQTNIERLRILSLTESFR